MGCLSPVGEAGRLRSGWSRVQRVGELGEKWPVVRDRLGSYAIQSIERDAMVQLRRWNNERRWDQGERLDGFSEKLQSFDRRETLALPLLGLRIETSYTVNDTDIFWKISESTKPTDRSTTVCIEVIRYLA